MPENGTSSNGLTEAIFFMDLESLLVMPSSSNDLNLLRR